MPLKKLEDIFKDPVSRTYRKGQIVLHKGDTLNSLYFVNSGYVKMYGITDDGEERIMLIFPPGSIFPIFANLISDEPYILRYFYETMSNSQLCVVPHKDFKALINKNGDAARLLLKYTTKISSDLVARMGLIENKDAQKKIVHLLNYLREICSEEIKPNVYRTNLKITQQDIANMTGLTRETSSIQLKKLKDLGIVKQRRGYLIIDTNIS